MRSIYIVFLLLLVGLELKAQEQLEPEADKKGRWGYVDKYGRMIIKYKYDDAYPFSGDIAIVKKGEKYGFIDRNGNPVGKIQYSVIEPYGEDMYLVSVGGKMIDQKMREKQQKRQDKEEKKRTVRKIGFMGITVIKFQKSQAKAKTNANDVIAKAEDFGGSERIPWVDAKWGVCDAKGNVIIPAVYEKLSDIIDDVIYIAKGDKYGILTADGKELLKPEYKQIGFFNNQGYCWVSNGDINSKTQYVEDKFGIVDKKGKVVLPPKYDLVGPFFDDDNSPYRYYAAGAKRVLYVPYSRIPESDCPYLWFSNKNLKAGVVDNKGNILIPADKYTTVFAPTCGMVPLIQKKEMGFFDISKKSFLPVKGKYTYAAYECGLSCVNTGGIFYFVDKKMNKVSNQYSTVTRFHDGLCVVGHGGKFGVIDSLGHEVVPMQYQNAKSVFSEGVLGVQKDGKWGFINTSGTEEFPFIYDNVDDFDNGFCTVSMGGKFGCMQRDGKLLLPIEWDDYLTPSEPNPSLIWAKKDGNFYCYDVTRKKLAFEKGYEDATNFANNVSIFIRDKKYGMVNDKGTEILPAKMKDFDMTEEAYYYLNKIEKDVMSEADYLRFLLFRSGAANLYKIGEGTIVIPEDKWDY